MASLEQPGPSTTTAAPAPAGLRILCILSWLGSLVLMVLSVGLVTGGDAFVRWAGFPVIDAMVRDEQTASVFYALLKILLSATSVFAVWQMWKLRRRGFWIYLSAEGLLLILPLVFLSSLGWPYLLIRLLTGLIFTLLMIFLFALYFKRMK